MGGLREALFGCLHSDMDGVGGFGVDGCFVYKGRGIFFVLGLMLGR